MAIRCLIIAYIFISIHAVSLQYGIERVFWVCIALYWVSIHLQYAVYSQVLPPWRSCSGSAGAARTSSWVGSNAATCMSCCNSQSNSQSHHPWACSKLRHQLSLSVFWRYSNVLSCGDGNTCICECILKYYDVFRVAFENTCINAAFFCILSVFR